MNKFYIASYSLDTTYLSHHGIPNMKWGVKNGPPYPLSKTEHNKVVKKQDNNTKINPKEIAQNIHKQVMKDSKPPTGNQNCQLCTWCAEATFRGIKNPLPRPVYSPRDPELQLKGEDIVKDAKREKFANFNEMKKSLKNVKDGARYYVHVNWNGSTGGHEFLLIKDKVMKIMDPQAGTIEPFNETSKYFKDINYKNSYISRLDNKDFNEKLFNEVNDKKNVLEFNPSLDIPYMLKEGMISKEEYEEVMKNPMIMYEVNQLVQSGAIPQEVYNQAVQRANQAFPRR